MEAVVLNAMRWQLPSQLQEGNDFDPGHGNHVKQVSQAREIGGFVGWVLWSAPLGSVPLGLSLTLTEMWSPVRRARGRYQRGVRCSLRSLFK